jgi:hypothetical protein
VTPNPVFEDGIPDIATAGARRRRIRDRAFGLENSGIRLAAE